MKRVRGIPKSRALLLLLFSATLIGCVSETTQQLRVDAVIGNSLSLTPYRDASRLPEFEGYSYLTEAKEVDPAYGLQFTSAMESAIYARNFEAIEYLVNHSAPKQVSMRWSDLKTGQWQRTPINVAAAEMACAMGDLPAMRLLHKYHPQDPVNLNNCLHFYLSQGITSDKKSHTPGHSAQVVEEIIALGADVNSLPTYGKSLNSMAVALPLNTGILKVLLTQGLKVNSSYECIKDRCTYLTSLPNYNDVEHVKNATDLLVEYGADVNLAVKQNIEIGVSNSGNKIYEVRYITPLHAASYYDRPLMFEQLIALGANPNKPDNKGVLPYQYANMFDFFEKKSKAQKLVYEEYQQSLRGAEDNNSFWANALIVSLGALEAVSNNQSMAMMNGSSQYDSVTDIIEGKYSTAYEQAAKADINHYYQRSQVTPRRPVSNTYHKAESSAFSPKDERSRSEAKESTVKNEASSNQGSKPVDCTHEYIRAEMHLRNAGHFNFGNCDVRDVRSQCSSKRAIERRGAINTELRSRGFAQCQQAIKKSENPSHRSSQKGGTFEM